MLISSEEFGDIFDFFFQHFAEDADFYELGKASKNDVLPIILKGTGKRVFGENCQLEEYRMTEIEAENFVHGTCFMDGHIVLVIYFTDLNIGLASISTGGARFNFVHLKATVMPKGLGVQFPQERDRVMN